MSKSKESKKKYVPPTIMSEIDVGVPEAAIYGAACGDGSKASVMCSMGTSINTGSGCFSGSMPSPSTCVDGGTATMV